MKMSAIDKPIIYASLIVGLAFIIGGVLYSHALAVVGIGFLMMAYMWKREARKEQQAKKEGQN